MTMKAHTYYIIFGRPPIGGKLPPSPLAAPLVPTALSTVLCAAAEDVDDVVMTTDHLHHFQLV